MFSRGKVNIDRHTEKRRRPRRRLRICVRFLILNTTTSFPKIADNSQFQSHYMFSPKANSPSVRSNVDRRPSLSCLKWDAKLLGAVHKRTKSNEIVWASQSMLYQKTKLYLRQIKFDRSLQPASFKTCKGLKSLAQNFKQKTLLKNEKHFCAENVSPLLSIRVLNMFTFNFVPRDHGSGKIS